MSTYDPAALECLAAIVEEGGFERAAQRLNVTQSAVSQRLRFSPVVVSPPRKRPAAAVGGVTRGVVVPTARGISKDPTRVKRA